MQILQKRPVEVERKSQRFLIVALLSEELGY